MINRRLLEIAVEIHGVNARWSELSKWINSKGRKWKVGDGPRILAGIEKVYGTHSTTPWNPLEDSALAFELAAKHDVLTNHAVELLEQLARENAAGHDKEKALRRAIVVPLVEAHERARAKPRGRSISWAANPVQAIVVRPSCEAGTHRSDSSGSYPCLAQSGSPSFRWARMSILFPPVVSREMIRRIHAI